MRHYSLQRRRRARSLEHVMARLSSPITIPRLEDNVSPSSWPHRFACALPAARQADKRQCLRLPGHKDENMLVLVLAALDQYRNGKTGTLTGINITAGNEKIIIDQFNVTGRNVICRKDSDDNGLLPCPTVLWIGELSLELRCIYKLYSSSRSSTSRSLGSDRLIHFSAHPPKTT